MCRITNTTLVCTPLLALAVLGTAHAGESEVKTNPHPLAGTWTLVAADAIKPDGTQIRDYGAAPKGRLLIDPQGRYSLQIFKSERPAFVSGNKAVATAAEYESAVMGSSTHYGEVSFAAGGSALTFSIEASSFPNWEGTRQTRQFELKGDVLTYRVPPRQDGNVPVSVWQRVR